jgi:hypothetical protein
MPDSHVNDSQYSADCTFWIRHSTGRLCTDLIQPNSITHLYGLRTETSLQGLFSLSAQNMEAAVIRSLTLDQYHDICYWSLSRSRVFHSSCPIVVNLGAILFCSPSNRLDEAVEIALLSNPDNWCGRWETTRGAHGDHTEDGWSRY